MRAVAGDGGEPRQVSAASPAGGKRLALGIAVTRDIPPEEVGTMAQVREVAAAVRRAQAEAGITDASNVHYVQVKGPLLTPAAVADADHAHPDAFGRAVRCCFEELRIRDALERVVE